MEQVDKLLGGDVLCGELCRKNGPVVAPVISWTSSKLSTAWRDKGHLVRAAAVLHADGGDGPERVVKINFFPSCLTSLFAAGDGEDQESETEFCGPPSFGVLE